MKFGALYSYWGHEWKCDYIETAKRMHACGCEVLEVGAPHLLDMTDEQLKELKDTCDGLGMEITSNIGPAEEYERWQRSDPNLWLVQCILTGHAKTLNMMTKRAHGKEALKA